MPIYEYKCENCAIEREVMQKMTEKPLTVCEKCGGRLKKMISNTSFVLKGSGWYVTDYADKNRKNSANEVADKKEKTDKAEHKESNKIDRSLQKEQKKEKTESPAGKETKTESKSEPKASQKSKE